MTLPASGPISQGQIADEFGISRQAPFPSAFYGKGGAPSSGPLSFANFYGRSAALSVSVSPSFATGSDSTGTVTSNSVTASATGGTAPYSFAWTKQSGDIITIGSPSAATTIFQASGMTGGEERDAVFQVTATDANGVTGTTTVGVTLNRTGGGGGGL